MAKCRACGKFLASSLAAVCGRCSACYHKACIALPEDIQLNPDWICPECKSKLPKGNNTATPVKGIHGSSDLLSDTSSGDATTRCTVSTAGEIEVISKTDTQNERLEVRKPVDTSQNSTQLSNVDLGLELRLFREEMRKVREEFKEFRQEIAGLHSMISNCNSRVDQFENRLTALEAKSEDVSTAKVSSLEQTISQLKQELNDRDQDLLRADIEISNLPENKGENPVHTVTVLAAKLGLTLKQEDIVFAERVGKASVSNADNSQKKNRRLVVRLSRCDLRDELLRSARVRRNVTSADLGMESPAKRFYVNERLTSANRKLFYLVRESTRQLRWKYTWTKHGRIYARQEDGKRAYLIRTEEDRMRVFGNDDVSETKV